MKLTTILAGLVLALGAGIGMNAHAMTLSECCQIMQEECELNYTPAQCGDIYGACMRARRCFIN